MADQDLTLLSEGQIRGNSSKTQLEVMRKYGTKAAITDLCILTGGYVCNDFDYNIEEDKSLTGIVGWCWTKTADSDGDVYATTQYSSGGYAICERRNGTIRPVLQSSKIFSQIYQNRVKGFRQTEEVEYGEYPQNAADSKMQDILNLEYLRGLKKTGRSYTFDSVNIMLLIKHLIL